MSKFTITVVVFALLLTACPGGGSDSGKQATTSPGASNTGGKQTGSPATQTAPVKTADADPIQRGYEIFHTTEYSNTSLACVNCHADSERSGTERVFIASSGHGAFSRGAWKITSQAQLEAGAGHADTLIDAANICVVAPYLNHAEQLIEGSDAESLLAYLESIATADEAFVIERPKQMPVGGLLNDDVNGYQIYHNSCRNCHDADLKDVPELVGVSDWLNALQLMAKIRKIGDDYYGDWEGMDYSDYAEGEEIPVSGLASSANPCSDNPCGDGHDHSAHGAGPDSHGAAPDRMFAEGAMPYYSTRILSDQDVVDVAYFLAKQL